MNILMINHYAGSDLHGMEYRPFYLAREWMRLGHNVFIVAASYSHLRSREPVLTGMVTEEEIEGIRYFWLKAPRYKGNGLLRVMNMLVFGLMLAMLKGKLTGLCKPHLVIASSPHPFIIFGAKKIAVASNAGLMFEVRDLWPLTLTELGGISPRHPFVAMMQLSENYAYRNSDRIISLLPKADGHMKEHGLKDDKFVYIPNGISPAEWRGKGGTSGASSQLQAIHRIRQMKKIVIGYAGAHGLANELYTLIEAAALLQSHPVFFVMAGHGPEKARLQQKALNLGLDNVLFMDSVPRDSVRELLALMDILYIGLKKESLFRFGISPNKLMDYMMAGRPVIHAIEAGNDLVAESGCGISVPPEDPGAIAAAIIRLTGMTSDERRCLGAKGRDYVMANHDYAVLAKRYLDSMPMKNVRDNVR